MENTNEPATPPSRYERWRRCRQPKPTRSGRVMGGIIVLLVGVTLLAKEVGVLLPSWLFTWQMLLITAGVYIGAKHNFRGRGWFIPIIIGFFFLLGELIPNINLEGLFWPVVIILAGLCMILIPRRNHGHWRSHHWKDWAESQTPENGDDKISSTAVFGSVKKNVLSKNFLGGEVTCVFGGAEINLSQADIQGRVVLELTQVFGGTRLIIPPHWDVRSEMTAVLGGIEDKRPLQKDNDSQKILVIEGTSVMGGIEITSF